MRGKGAFLCLCSPLLGITPAHAGKSWRLQRRSRPIWDHPRTCGEKIGRASSCLFCLGSPPHMRGKVVPIFGQPAEDGITPAHAGKSFQYFRLKLVGRDHPRTCGEKSEFISNKEAILGSPPHMRGKDIDYCCATASFGDHPRTCGEKAEVSVTRVHCGGSPPHMRGKGIPEKRQAGAEGITPAHAGKSCPRRGSPAAWWDHPRTCGEKARPPARRSPGLGSPPHMRGKAQGAAPDRRACRITPAHAGKRRSKKRIAQSGRDHPRTCGEKLESQDHFCTRPGSPPHMRGKV